MRLMVCAGASGGGVYPALAVLQALGNDADVLWVGGEGGMEAELVSRAGIPFKAISAEGVHGVGLRAAWAVLKLMRGFFQARALIADFQPDALFFTGGYVAAPVALAGRDLPTMICLPDIEPGQALRLVSRFADRIAVPAADSRAHFNEAQQAMIRECGYPTRAGFAAISRADARRAFDLDPEKPTLLVTGGSKGALSINRALMLALPVLLREMQVIHISGSYSWPEVQDAAAVLPAELRSNYRAYEYLHDRMGAAYAAADLAVTRAGASTIGELPLFGLPAVLVPYPHAWRYQKVNADYLARHGAALGLADEDLALQLTATVQQLMHNDNQRAEMSAAMRSLAAPDAAACIAAELRALAHPQAGVAEA